MTEAVKEPIAQEEVEAEQVSDTMQQDFSPEEIDMAKKYGISLSQEQEEPEVEEGEEVEEQAQEQQEQPETVEEDSQEDQILRKMEEGEDLTPEEEKQTHAWEPDKKAFYWKWKSEKQKRQTFAKQKELSDLKVKASAKRIQELEDKIKKIESGEYQDEEDYENLTKEQAIEKAKSELQKKDEPDVVLSKEIDYKKSLIDEMTLNEKIKNPDFEQIEREFMSLVEQNPQAKNMFLDKVQNFDGSRLAGRDLISFVYAVVEDSGYKAQPKMVDKSVGEKTKRIIKNSTKPTPTAAISTGSVTTRTIDEIEAADVLNMSDSEWADMSESDRERILMRIG